MSVQFSTTEYEFSHGHTPRGRGSWAFFFDREKEPRWWNGTYTEAKKQATEYAKQHNHGYVKVGS